MSKHRRMLVVLAASIAGLVALLRIESADHRIVLPEVDPDVSALERMEAALPAESSQAVVTFLIPIQRLRRLAAESTPRSIGGEHDVPDTGGFGGIRIRPNLTVEPVMLEPVMPDSVIPDSVMPDSGAGSAPLEFSIRTRVQGEIGVSAFRRIAVGPIKTETPRFSKTVHIDAAIDGTLTPGISPGWEFTHQEVFQVDVRRADLEVPLVGKVDVRDMVRAGVDAEAPAAVKNALDRVSRELPIRAAMDTIWRELQRPLRIGENPTAQILLRPRRIRIRPLAIDGWQHLILRAAVDGDVQTLVGAEPLEAPAPPPLPDAKLEPGLDPKFRLLAPLGIELQVINDLLRAKSANRKFDIQGGVSVEIRDVRLVSKEGRLYVKLDVDARTNKLGLGASGSVYLTCGVAYDAGAQQLRLKDVKFAAETRSLLQNVAVWLMNDEICRLIERDARIDLGERLGRLTRDINGRFAAIEFAPGARLEPRLETLEFDQVCLADNLVILVFRLGGEIVCRFDPGDK